MREDELAAAIGKKHAGARQEAVNVVSALNCAAHGSGPRAKAILQGLFPL